MLELAEVSGVFFIGEKGGEDEVLGPCWYLVMIVYELLSLVAAVPHCYIPCDKPPQRLVHVEVHLEKELVFLAADLLEDVAKQL